MRRISGRKDGQTTFTCARTRARSMQRQSFQFSDLEREDQARREALRKVRAELKVLLTHPRKFASEIRERKFIALELRAGIARTKHAMAPSRDGSPL
jgi:hypothetical protein